MKQSGAPNSSAFPATASAVGFAPSPVFSPAHAPTTQPSTRRPNLLVIQTDELNFRTLGCYRATLPPEQAFMWGRAAQVETPNIDWIARHGVLCTRFYANSPVCSPSRASFVSGRYPQNTPVVNNDIPLNDDIVTFAEILRRQGYATGYAGKWHLDGDAKPGWAPSRRFGFDDNRYMYNRGHFKLLRDTPAGPEAGWKDGKPCPPPVDRPQEYSTDFLTDRALEFLQAHQRDSFCYMLSIPDPHPPDLVREPYSAMFRATEFEKPRTFDAPRDGAPSWARPAQTRDGGTLAEYFGMVKCIDDNVGRILAYLRESRLIENTLIVFTADHGAMRGEHHRESKGVPLDGSAKAPLLVYLPDRIPAGTVVGEALATVDFLPTVLSLMGVDTLGTEEGRDASALLETGRAPERWHDAVFVRGTGGEKSYEHWVAAFSSRHKLILSLGDRPWLIDLSKDPDELVNFCGDPSYREIARGLAADLLDYGAKFHDPRVFAGRIADDLRQLSQTGAIRLPRWWDAVGEGLGELVRTLRGGKRSG